MRTVLINTFITIYKNWQILLLLIIPSIVIDLLKLPQILSSLCLIVAQIIIYMYLLRPNDFDKLKEPKFVLKFVFALFIFGIISIISLKYFYLFIMFLYIFIFKLDFILESKVLLFLAVIIPIHMSLIYLTMRFRIIFPMIIMENKLSIKKIYQISKSYYWSWIAVITIFYSPLLILIYHIGEGVTSNIVDNISALLLCCFYSCYYLSKRL